MLEPTQLSDTDASRPPVDACTAFWLGTVNFPGDFERLPDIVKQLLVHADTIELQFRRNASSTADKFGVVKACFSSREDAIRCYDILNELIVASERRWDLSWLPEELNAPVDQEADHTDAGYLSVSGFPDTMDRDAIIDMFGRHNVLDVIMNAIPADSGLSFCIVKFKTQQLAKAAEQQFQGYELVVGNEKSQLLIQPYATESEPAASSQSDEAMDTTQGIPNGEFEDAIELSAEQIQLYLKHLMVRERINWAEVNTEEELWALLNKFTKEAGWQPEETLKDAMMLTLRSAVEEMGDLDWMTDHLNSLIRKWSKVVENATKSKTRRRLQLMDTVVEEQLNGPGAGYVPPPEKSRKRRKNRGQGLMTVGSLLSAMKCEAAKADVENGSPPRQKACRKRDESSESGEASSSSESEQEDYNNDRDRVKSSSLKIPYGSPTSNRYHSNAVEPELVEQVVSSVLRMMPMINEWRASKITSDRPLCQDVATMNFTVPPPPLPRLPFGFLPPQVTGTLPANCSLLLGGLPMVPSPAAGQPMQSANFTANSIAPFYCIPPPPPPPPPPPSRQF